MSKYKLNLYYFMWTVHSVVCQPHFEDDKMGKTDKIKVMWLTEDLMRDSMLKMRQIMDIREEHETFIAFNVGILIGKIREKYRHMIEVYKENLDKANNRTTILGPGTHVIRPFHTIIALEMMHYLFVEIDRMVDVVVSQAEDELEGNNLLVPATNMLRSGKEEAEEREIVKEEAAKSLLRQQYLMRRLGRPANLTTTRKRFMKQWPVEDTWSREEYSVS